MVNRRPSRWFPYFAVGMFGLGIISVLVSWMPVPPGAYPILLVLMIAAFAWENAAVPLPRGGEASLVFPMIFAATLLLGPSAAGLVAFSSTVTIREVKSGKSGLTVIGNGGVLSLSSVLPAWVYLGAGGRVLVDQTARGTPLSSVDFPAIILPLLAFVLSSFLMNVLLVGVGLSLRDGIRLLDFLRSVLPWSLPSTLSFMVLGLAMAQVLTVHLVAFILLVLPLVVARQVYQRYLGLRGMYRDTVRSLVAAVEAKDPYTRGHSERVARYASCVARRLGLSEHQVERVHTAAQLHDLGKVAVSSEILGKPSALSSEEYREIHAHPELGASIVAGVPALGDLSDVVRHHHERYDGTGYAIGLSGEEIPLESRILAVADSYDAMTTGRAYRSGMAEEDALLEILACAGSQFDPTVVEQFVAAAREGFCNE